MSNVVMMGRTTRIVARVVVGIAILAVVGPLLWVIRFALRPQALFATDPAGMGGGFTFGNLADAWSIGGLGHALRNSALVVVPGPHRNLSRGDGRMGHRRLPVPRSWPPSP